MSRLGRSEAGWVSPAATTTALVSMVSGLMRCGVRALTTRVAAGLTHPASDQPSRSPRARQARAREPRRLRGRVLGVLGGEAGFTLIELLVVIIVLGLLVGLVGPRLFGRVGQSKQAAARAQIELLGAALDQYRLDVGGYPNSGQGLDALQRNPNVPNWNGPYLKKAVPKDPWGNAYKFRCCPGQNGEYDLWSEGSDGAPGGEGEAADITSWDSSQK
jgi:general secretion pathway protein G